jgi:hypothetical protein
MRAVSRCSPAASSLRAQSRSRAKLDWINIRRFGDPPDQSCLLACA